MKTKFILFLLAVLIQSCVLDENEFTNERTNYVGKAFRLDGCYIRYGDSSIWCRYNFFYRNGIMFRFSDSCGIENVNQFKIVPWGYNSRPSWTIFHVKDNRITVKYWEDYPSLFSLPSSYDYYNIINDTTLSHLDSEGKTEYYNFKKFTTKPDSINRFIK